MASEMTNQAAKLADDLTRPASVQEGYTAERHPLVSDLIVVWSPCGCYWVGHDGKDRTVESFVTACQTASCDFKWVEIERALEALKSAEASISVVPPAIEAVEDGDGVAVDSGGVPGDVLETGAGSEGAVEEPSEPEGPEGQTVSRTIEDGSSDMINEGGPVPEEFDLGGEGG